MLVCWVASRESRDERGRERKKKKRKEGTNMPAT
jgi:hypothetical protein